MTAIENKIIGLSNLIGNTPLLQITYLYEGEERTLFAKAEHHNMTGSIKDRMVLHIIRQAYRNGNLKHNARIVEVTSGNTGISFSAIGSATGFPVTIFMPDWMSEERKRIIRSFGADIRLVSKDEGGFIGAIQKAEQMSMTDETVFLPRQFSNEDNIDAHASTTGPEIWWQLQSRDIAPDAFIAGVGTGGTIMGVGKFLKNQNPKIKIYPLEPFNSPTLSTGYKTGKHRIEGISDEFIPPIIDFEQLDEVVSVDDGDSIIMAQKLSLQLGLGVGISSGANFLGALKAQNKLGNNAVVVTVFPDDNKKYLSTDLLKDEPIKSDYLSKDVELLQVSSIKRMCDTCCNSAEYADTTAL